MMKLKPFTLVSLLLMSLASAFACGPYYCSSAENDIYRLLPYGAEGPGMRLNPDFSKSNILLWSKQTGCRDTAAIRQALYTGWDNPRDWEALLECAYQVCNSGKRSKSANDAASSIIGNKFCRRLVETGDTDAVRLICWSKKYSVIRNAQQSPWYYNSQVTDERRQMHQLMADVRQYTPTPKYADRYAFLTMKCQWALGDDNATLALWRQLESTLQGSLFLSEAEDYAARSLYRLGRTDEACRFYMRRGDIGSVMQIKQLELPDLLKTMLQIAPESPVLAVELQRLLFSLENNPFALTNKICTDEGYVNHKEILPIAQQAAKTTVMSQRAMWCYTAACLLDYQNQPKEALRQLDGIDAMPCDAFLKNSIRVLRFHLRSKTEKIDDEFEKYAIGELRWMDKELQNEWKQLTQRQRFKMSHVTESGGYSMLRSCYMYDAMRRILLSDRVGLCWRLSEAGRHTRALQLANMAENRMFILANNPMVKLIRNCDTTTSFMWNHDGEDHPGFIDGWLTWYEPVPDTTKWATKSFEFNGHDYSNWMFLLADRMSAQQLDQYRQRQLHPAGSDDRWLNERGYIDNDYWEDIVGTHYLRECNYPAAVEHLEKVSSSYQQRMNIRCIHDPFGYMDKKPSHDKTGYKLNFARRMAELQQQMQTGSPDSRGLAMLEYSIGMRNSFGQCWYLTTYGHSKVEFDLEYLSIGEYQLAWNPLVRLTANLYPFKERYSMQADQLQCQAFNTLESDEAKAKYYARLYMMRKVIKDYGHTQTGKYYALVCDERAMYSPSRKTTAWFDIARRTASL